MKMQDLPIEVQVIAAQILKEKIERNDGKTEKEPVESLAQEVRMAFTGLYPPPLTEKELEFIRRYIRQCLCSRG
jgi:hypothetical protein